MAGERETFYLERPGTNIGRIDPTNYTPTDGDYAFAIGSETPGRKTWLKKGDSYEIYQTDSPAAADKILRFDGKLIGPTTSMPTVSLEVGPPNFFVLAHGQTLILRVDEGTNQTITFLTTDFADITKAKAQEIVDVLNANLSGATSYMTGRGGFYIQSDANGRRKRVEVIGGTASALGMEELAWQFSVEVNSDVLATRILQPGEQQTLSNMGANLINYIAGAPFTIRFKLEVVGV